MANDHVKRLVEALEAAAVQLGVSPRDVTKRELLDSGFSMKVLDRTPGLKIVKDTYYPITDKDLKGRAKISEIKSYVNRLESQIGKAGILEEDIKAALNKIIVPLKIPKAKLPKSKSGVKREVVVMLNDCHYGLVVPSNEVGGVNSFSWTEACRRTAYLAKQVGDYKIEKRGNVDKLHIVLNGDMIQGTIHDLNTRTMELLSHQQNGTIHILTYFIGYCAQFYKQVCIHGLSGNHDDSMHRREHGHRVTSHKADSNLAPVYFALSAAFRDNKNIEFNIPPGMYTDINLPGGRCLVTHGDTMFSKQLGNPGKSLNTDGIGAAINKYNYGEIEIGKKPYKLCLFGHVHSQACFTTFDGTKVYIAPSLSGIDIYAKSLAINNNQIGQVLFESTREHIFGDARLVKLNEADKDNTLDSIIPIYKNNLQWQK